MVEVDPDPVGPVIALSVALGLHLEVPALKGFNFQGGILVAHSFTRF